jgi:hypothetical protein
MTVVVGDVLVVVCVLHMQNSLVDKPVSELIMLDPLSPDYNVVENENEN